MGNKISRNDKGSQLDAELTNTLLCFLRRTGKIPSFDVSQNAHSPTALKNF